MKRLTREWIKKAEADFQSVQRELRARKHPNLDGACFHAQQCIEKYLKARLQEVSIRFDRTHDLCALVQQLSEIEPTWLLLEPALRPLSAYAVVFRYPGRTATKSEASEAIKHASHVRELARATLRLAAKSRLRAKRSPAKRSSRGK